MTSSTIIQLNKVDVQLEGKMILSSLSFSIQKGERVALIGPSGAGKTTLLNVLSKFIQANNGTVFIGEKNINDYSNQKQLAKKIGMIRQQYDLIEQLPVIQNVLVGRLADWGFWKSVVSLLVPLDKTIALQALERVGLKGLEDKKTKNLSGGQQQRVALARLLVQKPEIILADEPVASLDPARAEDVLTFITELVVEENQTLITSIHSVAYARKYFTRVIALKEGKIYFDKAANDVTDEDLQDLYQLEQWS